MQSIYLGSEMNPCWLNTIFLGFRPQWNLFSLSPPPPPTCDLNQNSFPKQWTRSHIRNASVTWAAANTLTGISSDRHHFLYFITELFFSSGSNPVYAVICYYKVKATLQSKTRHSSIVRQASFWVGNCVCIRRADVCLAQRRKSVSGFGIGLVGSSAPC